MGSTSSEGKYNCAHKVSSMYFLAKFGAILYYFELQKLKLVHVKEFIFYLHWSMRFMVLPFAVADTLLWKDRKQTVITLILLFAIYFNFIASGFTIITALSKLLLVISVFLFIHGNLPGKLYVQLPFWICHYTAKCEKLLLSNLKVLTLLAG